jgi:hypothetical protein
MQIYAPLPLSATSASKVLTAAQCVSSTGVIAAGGTPITVTIVDSQVCATLTLNGAATLTAQMQTGFVNSLSSYLGVSASAVSLVQLTSGPVAAAGCVVTAGGAYTATAAAYAALNPLPASVSTAITGVSSISTGTPRVFYDTSFQTGVTLSGSVSAVVSALGAQLSPPTAINSCLTIAGAPPLSVNAPPIAVSYQPPPPPSPPPIPPPPPSPPPPSPYPPPAPPPPASPPPPPSCPMVSVIRNISTVYESASFGGGLPGSSLSPVSAQSLSASDLMLASAGQCHYMEDQFEEPFNSAVNTSRWLPSGSVYAPGFTPTMITNWGTQDAGATQDHCPSAGAVGAASPATCTLLTPRTLQTNVPLYDYPTSGATGAIMTLSQQACYNSDGSNNAECCKSQTVKSGAVLNVCASWCVAIPMGIS